MPIIDREVIGEGTTDDSNLQHPNLPLGIYLETVIQKNVAVDGDGKWMTDVSTGQSMTYGQLLSSIRAVASALRKRGLKTGDNLVIICANRIEIPLMSMAVWRAGGTQACLSVNLPSDAMLERIREIGSKFVLTDHARAGRIVDLCKRIDFVKEVFVVGDEAMAGCLQFNHFLTDAGDVSSQLLVLQTIDRVRFAIYPSISYVARGQVKGQFVSKTVQVLSLPEFDFHLNWLSNAILFMECPGNLDDVDCRSAAWLAYTSGTTGSAKCLVLSHWTVVGWLFPQSSLRRPSKMKILFVNYMTNTGGLCAAIGATTCHLESFFISNFSEEDLLAAISSVRPSSVNMFPAHVAWICKYPHLEKYDLSSVSAVNVVGSPLYPIYERQIFDKLPTLLLLNNMYGMSEVGLVCRQRLPSLAEIATLDKAKAIERHVFGSVGTVQMFCKLKVVDPDTGEKLGMNQVGEICIQTPFMLTGYLNKPKETANFIRDGWAHTGDQGYYDDNEQVYIVGRYKELIKYRNINILPSNIEKCIVSHPAVEDAAVVGLPHNEDGERPLAFIVLSAGAQISADQLMYQLNERVMEEEKLRGGLRFVDHIPRNDSGKIIRSKLMKLLEATW